MGIFAPEACGRSPKEIFDRKRSAFADDDDACVISVVEPLLVSPKLMAYFKWLIYTAAFKEPLADARGAKHVQFHFEWTFACKEDVVSKKLFDLEIWYDRFQPSKKRSRSLLAAGPRVLLVVEVSQLDDHEHEEPARGAGAHRAAAALPGGAATQAAQ